MNISRQTFHKTERLCRTKIIAELFEKGNVFYSTHFKIVWNISTVNLSSPAQVAFSVSKKSFRLAVTRNLIKRRMKEAYRKNKQVLYDYLNSENIQVAFIIILRKSIVPDYQTVENSIKEITDKFIILIKEKEKKC